MIGEGSVRFEKKYWPWKFELFLDMEKKDQKEEHAQKAIKL